MMGHVVVWPAARFTVDGKRVVVTKGNPVPAGVDEATLRGLVVAGAVVSAGSKSSAGDEEVDLSTRPAKNAPVAVWRAYAQSIGLTEGDLDGLKKPEVIDAVIAAEDEPHEGDSPEVDGDVEPDTD